MGISWEIFLRYESNEKLMDVYRFFTGVSGIWLTKQQRSHECWQPDIPRVWISHQMWNLKAGPQLSLPVTYMMIHHTTTSKKKEHIIMKFMLINHILQAHQNWPSLLAMLGQVCLRNGTSLGVLKVQRCSIWNSYHIVAIMYIFILYIGFMKDFFLTACTMGLTSMAFAMYPTDPSWIISSEISLMAELESLVLMAEPKIFKMLMAELKGFRVSPSKISKISFSLSQGGRLREPKTPRHPQFSKSTIIQAVDTTLLDS